MAIDTSNWGREDLLREARMQTDAIQRIYVWLRLGYSSVAIGFLLGYWGFYGSGPAFTGPVGIVLLVVGAIVSAILKLGTTNARRNVERILAAAGVPPEGDGESQAQSGNQY